jgi:hypothetical protein
MFIKICHFLQNSIVFSKWAFSLKSADYHLKKIRILEKMTNFEKKISGVNCWIFVWGGGLRSVLFIQNDASYENRVFPNIIWSCIGFIWFAFCRFVQTCWSSCKPRLGVLWNIAFVRAIHFWKIKKNIHTFSTKVDPPMQKTLTHNGFGEVSRPLDHFSRGGDLKYSGKYKNLAQSF